MSGVRIAAGSINISKSHSTSVIGRVTPGIAIKFVGYGKESYQLRHKEISIYNGEFIILRDNTSFKASNTNSTQGCCINLDLGNFSSVDALLENDLLYGVSFSTVNSTQIGKNLSKLTKNSILNSENIHQNISNFSSLVKLFSNNLYEIDEKLKLVYKKQSTKKHITKSLFKSRDYIHKNYKEKITLDDLVYISGLSKYHFQRLFYRCFGETPLKMQQNLKLETAAKMIHEQAYSLTEIAYYIGYNDLASFSNQFKSKYSAAPSKYLYSQ